MLTDYDLPDGHGLELLEPPPGVPVILVTGAGDEELAATALRAGASDYLVKDLDRDYLQGLVATLETVRRRHASERERSMLEQALRNLNDAVYLVDAEGRLTYVNESFCHTYGYRAEEAQGQPSEQLWAPPEAGELVPLVPHQLPSGGQQGECRHRRRDGSVFARARPLHVGCGRRTGD
ncbi:MAG: PAS domain S-box protein, partial [Thermoanaerobaculia bacterium]|nr:PAS domain S-box protein [Thermoanaerobaculia bacterium]